MTSTRQDRPDLPDWPDPVTGESSGFRDLTVFAAIWLAIVLAGATVVALIGG